MADYTPSKKGCKRDFDDILKEVARKVRQNSEIDTLGRKLGFDPGDIYGYITANNKTHIVTWDGTLQMLRDWRKRQKESTERSSLKTALEQAEQIHLADDLFPSYLSSDIKEMKSRRLGEKISSADNPRLCISIGIPYAACKRVLTKHHMNFEAIHNEILCEWNEEMDGSNPDVLARKLHDADLDSFGRDLLEERGIYKKVLLGSDCTVNQRKEDTCVRNFTRFWHASKYLSSLQRHASKKIYIIPFLKKLTPASHYQLRVLFCNPDHKLLEQIKASPGNENYEMVNVAAEFRVMTYGGDVDMKLEIYTSAHSSLKIDDNIGKTAILHNDGWYRYFDLNLEKMDTIVWMKLSIGQKKLSNLREEQATYPSTVHIEFVTTKSVETTRVLGATSKTLSSDIKETELVRLAGKISPTDYQKLCFFIGIPRAAGERFLSKHHKNYEAALTEILCEWNEKTDGSNREVLAQKLHDADLDSFGRALLGVETTRVLGATSQTLSSDIEETELVRLAGKISPTDYQKLCIFIGIPRAARESVLSKHHMNYEGALIDILCEWNEKMDGRNREVLAQKLHEADLDSFGRALLEGHFRTKYHPSIVSSMSCNRDYFNK